MDEKNSFLSDYNKRDDGLQPDTSKTSAPKVPVAKDAKLEGYKYEQKSSFHLPSRKEGHKSQSGGGNKKLIIGLSAGGAALVLIILILIFTLSGGIEVIELSGRTLTEAQLWANQNSLNLQAEEVSSDDVEAGVIISQKTAAGTRVKKNDFVYVTVSLGPDLSIVLTLPDLMTMTKDEVEAWAEENHMTKVRVTAEYNDSVPAGDVIRYEINDNTVVGNEVRRDTPVYVIVSKGVDTTVEQVEVPDFKTMMLSECYVFANDNGLTLAITEQYDDYIAEGAIISQSVKALEKVPRGTEIKLVVSKGKKIEIPDFSDYSKEMAASIAGDLGIPVTIVERYSGASTGAFISQSLEAGAIYGKGDYLELSYSLGNKIVVPSFVGQTRDAIESWALELNAQGAHIAISATETNSSQAVGTITYQEPANTSVGVRKTISITVSKGKVVYMPDFISGARASYNTAITREQAIVMCEELNLVPVFKEGSKSGVLPGAIYAQSIDAGKEVSEGTKISLTYAASQKKKMLNFYGLSQKQALDKGDALFKIVFETAETHVDGVTDGYVVSQSIAKDTMTACGTTVTLYTNPPSDAIIDEGELTEP